MKNKYFSSLIAFLTLLALPSLNAAEVIKTKIIVDFKDLSGPPLTKNLINALSQNPSFDVLKEKTDNANYILTGNSQLIEAQTLIINLRILEAKTSHLVYAKKLTITGPQDTLSKLAICQITTILSETINPIKIDSIQGAYAFLNRGEGSNLHPGMKLQVFIPNASAVDLTTGEVLKDSEYPIAELKITEILPKLTKAQILRYSAPIEPGTLCRTIPECK